MVALAAHLFCNVSLLLQSSRATAAGRVLQLQRNRPYGKGLPVCRITLAIHPHTPYTRTYSCSIACCRYTGAWGPDLFDFAVSACRYAAYRMPAAGCGCISVLARMLPQARRGQQAGAAQVFQVQWHGAYGSGLHVCHRRFHRQREATCFRESVFIGTVFRSLFMWNGISCPFMHHCMYELLCFGHLPARLSLVSFLYVTAEVRRTRWSMN